MSQPMIPKRIVVHCSASKNGEYYGADQIDRDHKIRGFEKIGYHCVIQPDGQIELGRGLNEKGAHCIEANHDSIGICLIGNDKFTREQFKRLRYYIDSIMLTYHHMRKHDIYCHYQFKSAQDQHKTCPNIKINDLLAWYLLHDMSAVQAQILETK